MMIILIEMGYLLPFLEVCKKIRPLLENFNKVKIAILIAKVITKIGNISWKYLFFLNKYTNKK